MSFVSLEKYLYATESDERPKMDAPPVTEYFDFGKRIIAEVRSGLKGEALTDLAGELDKVRNSLHADSDAKTLNEAAKRFSVALDEFYRRIKKADQERADDFRKVLSTLKETFSQLSVDAQGSTLRFQKLDESLEVATKINDLKNLRTHLGNMLQFVRQEGQRSKQHSQAVLHTLGGQIRSTQENSARRSNSLSTRESAILAMVDALHKTEAEDGAATMYGTLYVADILNRLSALHGHALSDAVLDEFTKQRLQPAVPGLKIYRWSDTSLFVLGASQRSEAGANALFEYQAFLSDRITNFRIALRSVTIPVKGSLDELTAVLDQFAQQIGL